jgi:hypothetical protein
MSRHGRRRGRRPEQGSPAKGPAPAGWARIGEWPVYAKLLERGAGGK